MKASFFTCLTKQRISTKRRFSAFLHHKLVKIFRRIVTLPSSGWMNFVRVNVDVIWSRWYIDCRRCHCGHSELQKEKWGRIVCGDIAKFKFLFFVVLIWQVSGNLVIIEILLMKLLFVVTHRYTVLQETKLAWSSIFHHFVMLSFH